jgi:ribose transport system permease protein
MKPKTPSWYHLLAKSLSDQLGWPLLIIVLYLACIFAFQPAFFSPTNLNSLLYYTCLLVPALLGVHLLIVLGLFDLSIGAVAAACGVIAAKLMTLNVPIPLSVLLALIGGALFGVLNWTFVGKFKIPALIGTLITMGVARAVSLGLTEGQVVSGLPNDFGGLASGIAGQISPAVWLGIILVLVLEFLTHRHVIFRHMYHAGSNRIAAKNSGIHVNGLECMAFVLAGVGAALVGVLQCSRTLSASPYAFPDLALECIAACVIGGASLSGGSGRAVGAFFGMLMVVISRNLAVLAGVSIYWKELAISLVLLAAVLINQSKQTKK